MEICDAIDEAETLDDSTALELAKALVGDVERAGVELAADMKYPVDAHNRVMFLNYLHPDLMPALVYHLIRCGWRKDPCKRLVKQIPVKGSQFKDLVAYVPLDGPDQIQAPQDVQRKPWSVRPAVNVIDEKRPE